MLRNRISILLSIWTFWTAFSTMDRTVWYLPYGTVHVNRIVKAYLEMVDAEPIPSRKDRKRAEIVAIAGDLFFKEGYAGTSMSQIAAAVGGSKQTLYNYFQSKEELLLAVVRDVVEMNPAEYDLAGPPSDFRAWLTQLRLRDHAGAHHLQVHFPAAPRRSRGAAFSRSRQNIRRDRCGAFLHDHDGEVCRGHGCGDIAPQPIHASPWSSSWK